jgi:LysM repeat protein
MKRSVSFFSILITGVLLLEFSGCTKKEEVDLTDWSIPGIEKEVAETEEAVKPEEEASQAIIETQTLTYVVQKGDSISSIAKRHSVSPERLSEMNNLRLEGRKSIIYPGQKLIIRDVNKSVYYYDK